MRIPAHQMDQWAAALRDEGFTARDCATAASAGAGLAAGFMTRGTPEDTIPLGEVVDALNEAHANYHDAEHLLTNPGDVSASPGLGEESGAGGGGSRHPSTPAPDTSEGGGQYVDVGAGEQVYVRRDPLPTETAIAAGVEQARRMKATLPPAAWAATENVAEAVARTIADVLPDVDPQDLCRVVVTVVSGLGGAMVMNYPPVIALNGAAVAALRHAGHLDQAPTS